MLTRDERDYLAWVAAAAPNGRIVELGCFLGCSTVSLLAGLNQRDRRRDAVDHQARLSTYDSFVMPHGGGGRWAPGVREGEWFGDLFDANVAPHIVAANPRRLHVRHGWLPDDGALGLAHQIYPEQHPIDVLFVDLAKVWGVHNTVMHAFGSFVPVGGVLVQQDFKSWLPWLFLHMWQLRDHFEPVHDVPGGTIGFVRRSNTHSEALWTQQSFPCQRFDEVWDAVEASWKGFGSGQAALHAAMARGRHAIMIGRAEHGVECFERANAQRRTVFNRPELDPWRTPFDGIWADALVTMRRGLIKAGSNSTAVERAAKVA